MEEGKNDDNFSEEEEEILVYVNFEDLADDYSMKDLASTKILGLDSDEPIVQMGNKVFGGSWNEVVGTALFFEPTAPVPKRCYFSEKVSKPLKYFNKTTKQLNLKRIFISEKLNPSSADEAQATDWSDNDYEDSCDPGSSTEP
ncbi:hypothetical protein V9T40_009987 [Parthenolecanium corni]|uniref:Transcription factor TFIIIC triple barrel domain-containing protein n=1 Tax=Parthenolecanium corni TaxID=536013 RepID=A0AAN9TLF2_9HEMI